MSGYPEYKIGWICALMSEQAAAFSMLDERYDDLDSQNEFDENEYALGRIGKYKVVIASLPEGQHGTHNAAIVAAQMKYTFRHIKFVLMVGVAGGIPSEKHDVRLGDVVVSKPGSRSMGVVQHDFGTMTEELQHTHALHGPPRHLLNVIMKVQSEHTLGNSRISDYISAIFTKFPGLVEKYAHPGTENDQLFKANYKHVGESTCVKCDVDMLESRIPRRNNNPVIHYGTVLSANHVMKNAVKRDLLGKEYGALCFEMESGGLMNTYPCIIIRGICDYADTHKNKRWQAYAAVAAAAYAKEFLRFVTPREVEVNKVFMVRYSRNPLFTGREVLLTQLRETLCEKNPQQFNQRVAIYGMGGVGKTQIAIEYAYRYQHNYNDTYWVSASDEAALLSGFQEIAKKTRCVKNIDDLQLAEVAVEVREWLGNQTEWLLIFDNLEEIAILDDYLPKTNKGGHTLITTRNPDARDIPAKGFEISVFNQDDAIDLLCICSKRDNQVEYSVTERLDAVPIVQELGFLPLAIIQASAYIRTCCRGELSKYLPIYKASPKKLLRGPSDSQYEHRRPVTHTFLLLFGKIDSQAANLLRLFAFLNPDGILPSFLKAGCQGLSSELQEIVDYDPTFLPALYSLEKYSLISQSNSEGSIVIHRLIQAVLKAEMSTPEICKYRQEVVGLCDKAFPEFDHKHRELCRTFQNQVLEPALEAAEVRSESVHLLLNKIGFFLHEDGKYRDAARVAAVRIDIAKVLFGEEHPKLLASMHSLVNTYYSQGKLNEAVDIEEKVREIAKRTLGEEHPTTLALMGLVALAYEKQGKLNEAVDIQEEILEARRRILGEDHPETLTTMGELALLYWDQSKFNEAADMHEKIVDGRRRVVCEEHPFTLMFHLAMIYRRQGKLNEAVDLEKVQELTRIPGEQNPYWGGEEVLEAIYNLAMMC